MRGPARYLAIADVKYPDPGEEETPERQYEATEAALNMPLAPLPDRGWHVLESARNRVMDHIEYLTHTAVQDCDAEELQAELDRASVRLLQISFELMAWWQGQRPPRGDASIKWR
jgi:hypothetical protein